MAILPAGCRDGAPPSSLVLITLDTTRVDHLSCYGYERETTPHLDRLAEESVRFTRMWSTSSWTLPAHASLFTGRYPASHSARFDARGSVTLGHVLPDLVAGGLRAGRLSESATTLAELRLERGYRTGAFVGGPWLHRSFGLMQGFEEVDDAVSSLGGRPGEVVTDRAIRWLAEIAVDDAYFLFVNYFDAHAPYAPPAGFDDLPRARDTFDPEPLFDKILAGKRELTPAEREILIDRYDGEIRYMDHQLGRLLEAIFARPDGERALVIVTGDHGESFGEEGYYLHGNTLSEGEIRQPLLIRYPDRRDGGTDDETPVQLVDVLPIVASELGIAVPDAVEGVPLGRRRSAFAELYRNPLSVSRYGKRYDRDLETVIDWPFKLVRSDRGERTLVELDARRLREGAHSDAARADSLATLLDVHRSKVGHAAAEPAEVDAETYEALRALGYVE
jgi:arylsulfatase